MSFSSAVLEQSDTGVVVTSSFPLYGSVQTLEKKNGAQESGGVWYNYANNTIGGEHNVLGLSVRQSGRCPYTLSVNTYFE